MRIAVVGAGYVGLSTALVLSMKHDVTLVECDEERVAKINQGTSPIYEPEMGDLLGAAIRRKSLHVHTTLESNGPQDAVIICVGTPALADGFVDLSQIRAVMHSLKRQLEAITDGYILVVLRSTAPPGTTRQLILEPLNQTRDQMGVVYNPEFMRQGSAIDDIRNPDRVVVGESDTTAGNLFLEMFSSCYRKDDVPVLRMSLESAELCKYASNCFLAMKISFANEIASVAERTEGVDVDAVLAGVAADHRICPSHLGAGLGFGGSCLPKDVWGLIRFGETAGLEMPLLKATQTVNQNTTDRLLEILSRIKVDVRNKKVAVLGIAYKAGTDDTRESTTFDLIERLHGLGAQVWVHDPLASPQVPATGFTFTRNLNECTDDASVVFLMTDWDVYRSQGLDAIMKGTLERILVDGRRMFVNSPLPPHVTYRALGSPLASRNKIT